MPDPRQIVDEVERAAALPDGDEERFVGYGVMGVPFVSGNILCLRRFPTNSLGHAYTSVWHRDPEGEWIFIQDVPPQQACSRYFGSSVTESLIREIRIDWIGSHEFSVTIEGDYSLDWKVTLGQTMATQMANALIRLVPEGLWRSRPILHLAETAGSISPAAGRLSLMGRVPNGQRFVSNPSRIWAIKASTATWRGKDLGEIGPLPVQARIGDVWLPQQGRFFVGKAFLENFNPSRHLQVTSRKK